jgi:glycosyltransferase involved in cell wall biosynthesis
VLCPDLHGLPSARIEGVHVHRIGWHGPPIIAKGYFAAALALRLIALRGRTDIVHLFCLGPVMQIAVVLGKLLRVPVIVHVPGGGGEQTAPRRRRLDFLRLAARVQVLNRAAERLILARGVAPSRVVLVPNGLEPGLFRPAAAGDRVAARRRLDLPESAAIVLYLGRFASFKGVPVLLQSWESLGRVEGRVLVLVGATWPGDDLEMPRSRPGLLVREWTDAPEDYYHAADVFVLPSFTEGLPNAVLEAMSAGLPVVATPAAAPDGLVTDGVDGLIVPAEDAEALSAAIARLLDDGRLREELGSAAARSVLRYSISSVVDQLEAVYDGMLARHD